MRDKRNVARQEREKLDTGMLVLGWSRTVLQVALVGFFISLGYILYGLFSGKLRGVTDPMEIRRLVGNFTLMGQVLTLTSLLAAASLLLLTFGEVAYAVLIGIVGAGLMFGMPIIIGSNLDQGSDFAQPISNWCTNAGLAVLFLVGLRILWEIGAQVAGRPLGGARAALGQRRFARARAVDLARPKPTCPGVGPGTRQRVGDALHRVHIQCAEALDKAGSGHRPDLEGICGGYLPQAVLCCGIQANQPGSTGVAILPGCDGYHDSQRQGAHSIR